MLNIQGRHLGRIDDDKGVRQISRSALREMHELDTCVTPGSQTHASDGMATLLVTGVEKAKELSQFGPVAIIAHTIKGKGVSFMENKAGIIQSLFHPLN